MSAPLLLVIQHAEPETMGLLEPLCRERGIAWHCCRPYAGEGIPPATQPYQGLVLLGGPMSATETARSPFLEQEVRLLQSALRRSLPTLGICLGAQLLAQAAGGMVTRGPQPEIGWFPVRLTPEGRQDPLFAGSPEEFMTFHWHQDTYTLPPRGVHLAASAQYPQQAFRLGEQAYGLQFHPEVTPQIVRRWLRPAEASPRPSGQWAAEGSSLDPTPVLEGLVQHGEEHAALGRAALAAFLQRVVRSDQG